LTKVPANMTKWPPGDSMSSGQPGKQQQSPRRGGICTKNVSHVKCLYSWRRPRGYVQNGKDRVEKDMSRAQIPLKNKKCGQQS